MPSVRFTFLSLLIAASLGASPAFAQNVIDSNVTGSNPALSQLDVLSSNIVGNGTSSNDDSTTLGDASVFGNKNAISTGATVVGNNNSQSSSTAEPDTASGSVQVGRNLTTVGSSNVQLGLGGSIEGHGNITSGTSVRVTGDLNLVGGTTASVTGDGNVTYGAYASSTANQTVTIGYFSKGNSDGCVAIGSGAECSTSNEFSVGNTNYKRRVTNVQDGVSGSDAATVGQLRPAAAALGGGANYSNGGFIAPIYEFRSGAVYSTVGGALDDLDGRVTTLEQTPAGGPGTQGPAGDSAYQVAVNNGYTGNEQQWLDSLKGENGSNGSGSGSKAKAGANVEVTDNEEGTQTVAVSDNVQLSDHGSVQVGKTTVNAQGVTVQGGPSVTTAGINAGNQRVTNVANGRIEQGSSDAVNGGQLWEAQQAWNDRWTDTDRRLRHQDHRINALAGESIASHRAFSSAIPAGAPRVT